MTITHSNPPLFLFFGFILFGWTLVSCRKGELPEQYHYYGKVSVSLVGLPNTPDIEVRLGGEKLGAVIPGGSSSYQVLSQENTLQLFKAGTDSLLADTLITVPPNEQRDFRFAYSEMMGLEGFVAGGDVAADSVKVQLLNNLGAFYDAYPSIDVHIGYFDFNIGDYAETGIVIHGFSKGQLSAVHTLPAINADGNMIFYMARLKNAATGEFITQPSLGMDWFFVTGFEGGKTHVLRFYDMAGDVTVEDIPL